MHLFCFYILKVLVHHLSVASTETAMTEKLVDQKCPSFYAGKKLINLLINKKSEQGISIECKVPDIYFPPCTYLPKNTTGKYTSVNIYPNPCSHTFILKSIIHSLHIKQDGWGQTNYCDIKSYHPTG